MTLVVEDPGLSLDEALRQFPRGALCIFIPLFSHEITFGPGIQHSSPTLTHLNIIMINLIALK
jgi:hypothetical protein